MAHAATNAGAGPPLKRYALFVSMPMGQEDTSVSQVLQAYKEVLDPYVQAYAIGPHQVHLTPPVVASGGMPALFDTVAGTRTAPGRTAVTLATMGSRLLTGPVPPAGTPLTARAPPPLAPAFAAAAGGAPGPRPQSAPAPAFQGVPEDYKLAAADAAPAGGGAQPMQLTSGSGHAGGGRFSAFSRPGGHGMACSEFSASASIDSSADGFSSFDDGFQNAVQTTGPRLAAPGDGFRAAAPVQFGSGPPLVTEHADRREKRVGEADAEALAALRASRDRVMQEARSAAGSGSHGGGPAPAGPQRPEMTRSAERERDSGLMLTRPLGPSASAALAGGTGGGVAGVGGGPGSRSRF